MHSRASPGATQVNERPRDTGQWETRSYRVDGRPQRDMVQQKTMGRHGATGDYGKTRRLQQQDTG